MKTNKARIVYLMAAAVSAGMFVSGPGARADLTWDAGGVNAAKPVDGSGTWDLTSTLWSNGVTDVAWPNDGTVADFGNANGAAGTVTLGTAVNAGGLSFKVATSGNYTIAGAAGNTLTLIGATPTITVTGAINPVISAVVAGTAGLTYGGNGTLTLSGANTYSGNTQVNSGVLAITTVNGFGSGGSAVTVAAGGTVNTNSTGTLANAISLSGNGASGTEGALEDTNNSITYSGAFTLNGNARIGGSGHTMTFTNVTPITGGSNNIEFFGAASGNSIWKLAPAASNDASTWGAGMVTSSTAGNATLQIGHSNLLPATATLTLNATSTGLAVFDMDGGNSQTVAGLISTGTAGNDHVINSAATGNATLTISSTANTVFSGAILAGTGTSLIIVTKTGTGMQTLGGNNTYTGNTTISGGTLSVTGSLAAAGNVTVNAATLAGTGSVGNVITNNAAAVINPGATGAGSVGALTMASLAVKGGSLQFDLVNAALPSSNDSIVVTGTTTFTAASTIAPSAGTAPGTYTVLSDAAGITYNAFTPTLAVPSTPAGFRPGALYTLATNATNIQVTVTGGAAAIKWSGGTPGDGTTWDVGTTQNWNNAGSADVFFNGDSATFDDSAATFGITLNSTVLPGGVTFSNSSHNYTVRGSGSIGGATSLTVNGTGSVTLATVNGYSGGTTISSGTVNANASSALGTGPIVLGSAAQLNINNAAFGSGSLAINGGTIDNTSGAAITLTTNNVQSWNGNFTFGGSNSLSLGNGAVAMNVDVNVTVNAQTLTVGGAISNGTSGSNLTKSGAGTLALAGANTYTGTTTLNAGTILATNSASLGAMTGGAVTINSGATLDVGGDAVANTIEFGAKQFNIAGTGAGGAGAITNSNPTITQFNAFDQIALTGDATISGNRIDIGRRDSGDTLNLEGNTLTLNMSGSQPQFGIETLATVTSGNIVVAGGALDIELNATSSGTGQVTCNSGTVVQFFQATANNFTWPMVFKGNNVIGSDSATIGTMSSNATLQGNVTLEAVTNGAPSLTANNPLIIAGNLVESGGSFAVTKTGVSVMTLSGVNVWTSGTTIGQGTLALGSNTGLPTGTAVAFGDTNSDSGTLDLAGFNATVDGLSVAGGTANVIGNSSTTTASTLTFTGGTSSFGGVIQDGIGAGNQTVGLSVTGGGNLTLTGVNTYTGNTNINSGATLTIAPNGDISSSTNLTVNGTLNLNNPTRLVASLNGMGGTINLNTTVLTVNGTGSYSGVITDAGTNGGLTIAGTEVTDGVTLGTLTVNDALQIRKTSTFASAATSKVNALVIGSGPGTLDLTNSKLIVEDTTNHAATLATIKAEVAAGSPTTAGIFSSTLLTGQQEVVVDNAVAGKTTFGSATVDSGSILVVGTFAGDANLDGQVNISDLNIVASHWQQSVTDWSQGDFNGDGMVNIADLNVVAAHWQAGAGGGSSFSEALAAAPSIATPEPASLALLGIGAAGLLGRRRR